MEPCNEYGSMEIINYSASERGLQAGIMPVNPSWRTIGHHMANIENYKVYVLAWNYYYFLQPLGYREDSIGKYTAVRYSKEMVELKGCMSHTIEYYGITDDYWTDWIKVYR